MNNSKKEVKVYNAIFPVWLLILLPEMWLIVLPGNFLIDSIVLLISMFILKIEDKKRFYIRNIFKIYVFGMLSDIIGSLFLLFIVYKFGTTHRIMGDELYFTVPAIVIAAALIFILNYFISFRKLDKELRRKLSLIFAIVTAPYTFLIPISWM